MVKAMKKFTPKYDLKQIQLSVPRCERNLADVFERTIRQQMRSDGSGIKGFFSRIASKKVKSKPGQLTTAKPPDENATEFASKLRIYAKNSNTLNEVKKNIQELLDKETEEKTITQDELSLTHQEVHFYRFLYIIFCQIKFRWFCDAYQYVSNNSGTMLLSSAEKKCL